ncbi:DUF3089 domain-containing protein [Lewinella sp. 4G2]|uniref:DUF3089 domain-containing protein n=1 Tax=Lewinella sp. 4G2 TaxID=1803372 RepID=UPI0009ED274B|nr:DUF3089 domain-containing protein [Lewinella sp. 4G2]
MRFCNLNAYRSELRLFLRLCALPLFLLLSTCGSAPKLPANGSFPVPPPPEYASPANWAALPTTEDYADLTPGDQLQDQQANARADVFFLHPTHYRNTTESSTDWNANVYDLEINEAVDDGSIKNQASIFNAAGKIYAPRYRQANLKVYYSEGRKMAKRALDIAYDDILRAFDYYLKNHNNGRPIIIAGHSQGTTHAKRLLRDRFDGKPLQQQLVAAYLPGRYASLR